MEHTEDYVKLENVSKIYGSKEVKIIAVDEISFRIKKGELDLYSSFIIWCQI